jgi:hypothetical protein
MPKFLVRAEAVNFAWSCYDTQDLSTIRGGSMLLMNAHELIRGVPKPVVHGASQAIWSIEAETEEDARRAIEWALTDHPQLRHTTFVVDAVPASADDRADVKELRARNRWRQFQQPTLAVPEPFEKEHTGEATYCQMDFVRPGTATASKGGGKPFPVSESVKERSKFGKTQKQVFYRRFLPEEHASLEFASDLEEITSRAGSAVKGEKDPLKHLDRKMAVIYLDGNKQGEMAAGLGVKGDKGLKEFRDYLRRRQEEFLKAVLTQVAAKQPDWWNSQAKVARFETLLWGGDDILLVVPAWKGWEIVQLFFDHVQGNAREPWKFGDDKFTYSAGLVFCSHKASIHRMRDLAEWLLIQGKAQANDATAENIIAYEVLESIDVATEGLERWRAERLSSDQPNTVTPEGLERWRAERAGLLMLRPHELGQVAQMVLEVRREVDKEDGRVSRRTIERLARHMHKHGTVDADYDAEIGKALAVDAFTAPKLTVRQKLCHLAALWDYIL